MVIEAATTFERLTSYIVETQKRYRKEIFLQCNKRHCLVVRKKAFLLWFCFSPWKHCYVIVEWCLLSSPADLMSITDCYRGSRKISLVQRKYPWKILSDISIINSSVYQNLNMTCISSCGIFSVYCGTYVGLRWDALREMQLQVWMKILHFYLCWTGLDAMAKLLLTDQGTRIPAWCFSFEKVNLLNT